MPGRRGSSRPSESLPLRERLRHSPDYQRCYRQGYRRHGRFFVVFVMPNQLDGPRLGMTVSRKVGGAVTRNRVRRRIREIYRRWKGRPELASLDLVVHAKPPAGQADFAGLERELEAHLRRARRLGGETTA